MIKINTPKISCLIMGILITIPVVSYYYNKSYNNEKITKYETKYNNVKEELETLKNIKDEYKINEIKYNNVKEELETLKNKKDVHKINEINKSPIELTRRFDNKGYVLIYHNLSFVNVELNEFIELMRMYDLPQLDGCVDPDICNCKFRHKKCRIFMIRKCSLNNDIKFYSPTCNNVNILMPTNDDIKNETELHKFIKLYNDKFNNSVFDLVNYVKYIIDPKNEHKYIVDISLVAEPYYKGHTQFRTNGYGKPDTENKNKEKFNINTENIGYTLNWHQDQFIESKSKKPYVYDIIATFILSANSVTPHKLMIGKFKNEDFKLDTPNIDSLQTHIVSIADINIDNNCNSDIGYIIDQRRNIFHKHSDFAFNDIESRRNVCTIRIKYLH